MPDDEQIQQLLATSRDLLQQLKNKDETQQSIVNELAELRGARLVDRVAKHGTEISDLKMQLTYMKGALAVVTAVCGMAFTALGWYLGS